MDLVRQRCSSECRDLRPASVCGVELHLSLIGEWVELGGDGFRNPMLSLSLSLSLGNHLKIK